MISLWECMSRNPKIMIPIKKYVHNKSPPHHSQRMQTCGDYCSLCFAVIFVGVKRVCIHNFLLCLRHLWNPDSVRLRSLMCGRTWPLVTYYYSFSCCSKYWFIKGFSIWASWRPVKYHHVWRSVRGDREGGGQVRSLKGRGGTPPPPPFNHPLASHSYLFNSEAQQHFYQLGAIEYIVSSCFFALNFEAVLFISGVIRRQWSLSAQGVAS